MRNIEYIGKQFNRWTIIQITNKARFLCVCSCGTKKEVNKYSILSGKSKSCNKGACNSNFKDMTGNRIGRWIVLEYIPKGPKFNYYRCKCNCGIEKLVNVITLKTGESRSCGCLRAESVRKAHSKSKGEAAFNSVYNDYKVRSHLANRDFKLTKDVFKKLTQQNCSYCDHRPSTKKERNTGCYVYNGLDRIDNNKGYTIKNAIPCCIDCNKMKKNITLDMIKKIYYIAKKRKLV